MLLTVGRVVRPHGVRGEVVVEVTTDEPAERYAVGATLAVEPIPSPGPSPSLPPRAPGPGPADVSAAPDRAPATLTVQAQRPHQGRLIVAFEGVPDRDAAERLRGKWLRVDSGSVAPPSDPDEYHDHQLVGLAAVTPAGEAIGSVAGIDHAPAADLLVLERPDGGTVLVPFVAAIVPTVDLDRGRIVVDPPPGLLDL